MRLPRILAIAAVAATFGLDVSQAQAQVPAEFPPASYTGRQYVDSKGCVFVRAGIDGAVTWVPRVTRKRAQVCGAQPTGTSRTATAAARPATRPAPEPEIITVPTATAAATTTTPARTVTAAPAVKPKPVTVRRPAPAVATVPRTTTTTAAQPMMITVPATTTQTRRVATAPVTPAPRAVAAPAAAPRVVTAHSSCTGGSAISSQYMRHSSLAVRCGPQAVAHRTGTTATYAASSGRAVRAAPAMMPASSYTQPTYISPTTYAAAPATATYTGYTTGATRVAPRHVYADQLASTDGIYVPPGYQPVWTDDRLNPRRAHQTFAGKAQMDLVWTKTTPRRLIDRKTGRVVRPEDVGMQYPYTSYAQQSYGQHSSAGVTTISTRGAAAAVPQRTVPRNRSIHATYKDTPRHSTVSVSTRSARAQAARRAESRDR